MAFVTVNWLSILIAAVAAWLFGGAYYTALREKWLAAQGRTLEQFKAGQAGKSTFAHAAPFALAFMAEIVMAWALYGILIHMGLFSLRAGLVAGVLLWCGFVLTAISVNYVFSGHKFMLIVIDAGHWLGVLLIVGAVVGGMGR